MELTILPEIEKMLFALQGDELSALEASLLSEGIRDSLVVWPQNGHLILLDGHHRYRLAKKHNLPFEVIEKQFSCLDEALEWVDQNQLARRNLTDEQRTYVVGRLYERRKKQGFKGNQHTKELEVKFTSSNDSDAKNTPLLGINATAKAIASESDVSEKTIRNAADFAKAVDKINEISPEAANKILNGSIVDAKTMLPKIVKADEIADKVITEIANIKTPTNSNGARKISIKEIQRRIKDKDNKTPRLINSYDIEIRRGDFRKVLSDIPDKSVDVVLTDPPYGKRYLKLWDNLGRFVARILKPSGFLATYCGQLYLPEVLEALGKHLQWWWLCGISHLGNGNLTPLGQPVRKVINQFKPLLIYIPQDGIGIDITFRDLFEGHGSEKGGHNWQQPVEEAKEILQKLAPSGGVVVDPFAGSGSFGEAARQLGMRFFGAEVIDEHMD